MTVATEHPYVVTNSQILGGEPIVKSTRTPVRAVVESWRRGLQPEDIVTAMPHLSLAQVFDALSYYSDHQDEIDDHIDKNRIDDDEIHPAVREP